MENSVNEFVLAVLAHPFTWIFLALTAALFLIQHLVRRENTRRKASQSHWEVFGLNSMPAPIRTAMGLLWLTLFAAFLIGALFALMEAAKVFLRLAEPQTATPLQLLFGTSKADFRLYLLTLAAMTAGLSAIIALPFTLIRTKNLEASTRAEEQGLVTDRLNKAVEGLGAQKEVNRLGRNVSYKNAKGELHDEFEWKDGEDVVPEDGEHVEVSPWTNIALTEPNLEVRIGSIYALERIAKENKDYHVQVMEILCAYVRLIAPARNTKPTPSLTERPIPRDDIQTAIRVIGRRSEEGKRLEQKQRYRLDLRRCDLSGVDFSKRDYSAALFHLSRFEYSIFRETQLEGCEFNNALLNYSNWFDANLRGALLDFVTLDKPVPEAGGMVSTINYAKSLYGISLIGADISAVDYLGEAEEINQMFGTADTKLAAITYWEGWEDRTKRIQHELHLAERSKNVERINSERQKLKTTEFATWYPFPSKSKKVGLEQNKHWQRLDLIDFPFHGKPDLEQ